VSWKYLIGILEIVYPCLENIGWVSFIYLKGFLYIYMMGFLGIYMICFLDIYMICFLDIYMMGLLDNKKGEFALHVYDEFA